MTRLLTLLTLGLLTLTSCGARQQADLSYAKDCFDGCDRTYQEHRDDYINFRNYRTDVHVPVTATNSSECTSCNGTVKQVIIVENHVKYDTCTTSSTEEGVLIECPDGTSSLMPYAKDGADGLDGSDGADGADGNPGTLIEIVDPCGDNRVHDEVILKLTNADGSTSYVAYFQQGNKRFLTELQEGIRYSTTDGACCNLVIEDGVLKSWID